MYRKHSFEEKLNIVSQINNGHPLEPLCRVHGLDDKMVREWVRKYDLYGESGLHKRVNVRATPEFKENAVRLVIEKCISLPEVALLQDVSSSALKCWVKTQGYAGLLIQKERGRPLKAMGRAKKHIPITELEKHQTENARLRAENALLKKVKALVEEREARKRMSGYKPSKN